MKIAMTGATGLIGKSLSAFLEAEGHEIIRLQRPEDFDIQNRYIERHRLEGIDVMVHLAGLNLAAQKWTAEFKQELWDSRVTGTELVAQGLARLDKKPHSLIMASAVGYYGPGYGHVFTEDDGPGEGFLAQLCREWESAADLAEEAGIRVVKARLGVVLAREGGALEKMRTPFKLGLGGPIGSGKQAFPWIHLDDAVQALSLLLRNQEFEGPVNLVAPQHLSQKEFAKALGKAMRRPAFLPLPAFAARMVLGEMADEAILVGQTVEPASLKESGFQWKYKAVDEALREIFDPA